MIPEINIKSKNNSFYLDLDKKKNIEKNNSNNLNELIEKISNYDDCIIEDKFNNQKYPNLFLRLINFLTGKN